jgi:hypothetical protein
MERFCGALKRALSSKSQPWANLANHCLLWCWERQLAARYNVSKELEDAEPNYRRMSADVLSANETVYNGCEYDVIPEIQPLTIRYTDEDRIVSTPKREGYTMSHSDRSHIAEYFKAAIEIRPGLAAIKKGLPPTYCLWGKFRLGRSAHIHTTWADGDSDEHHESTYVRVHQVTCKIHQYTDPKHSMICRLC